jgi:hypothetical protein
MSPYVKKMVVCLVRQKEKLANVGFEEFQFWTETTEEYLVN